MDIYIYAYIYLPRWNLWWQIYTYVGKHEFGLESTCLSGVVHGTTATAQTSKAAGSKLSMQSQVARHMIWKSTVQKKLAGSTKNLSLIIFTYVGLRNSILLSLVPILQPTHENDIAHRSSWIHVEAQGCLAKSLFQGKIADCWSIDPNQRKSQIGRLLGNGGGRRHNRTTMLDIFVYEISPCQYKKASPRRSQRLGRKCWTA